jgi:type IV secretion system protein TrbB
MSDHREAAARAFRAALGPLLDLADQYPHATDLFVEGRHIRLRVGSEQREYSFRDFPGLQQRNIEAAAANAAVYSDVEFGPHFPAKQRMSVKIPPDLRVSAVCPPLAEAVELTVRFLRSRALTLDDYVAAGVMTQAQADLLRSLVKERKTTIISGGTGAGKTTLLRTLVELASHERTIVIEDAPELSIRAEGEKVRHWSTTQGSDMADLLRQALRMAPKRLVVGEVRGPEALEMIRAANTGHDGSMGTIHSNGAEEALHRLYTLVVEGQPTYPFAGVVRAVDFVIQIKGEGDERRVSEIWQVPKDYRP